VGSIFQPAAARSSSASAEFSSVLLVVEPDEQKIRLNKYVGGAKTVSLNYVACSKV